MVRDGYYLRNGIEMKVWHDEIGDIYLFNGEQTAKYNNIGYYMGQGGGPLFYTWLRPLNEEPEAVAASEPVYVYVAYMVHRTKQTKQAISHPDEQRFLIMISNWERQGYVVKAKKRIKFNLN